MTVTLESIYGEAAGVQAERYRSALAAFRAAYGPGPVLCFRAPGRVNLIGEHTDYNHGFVLPLALDRDLLLLARPRRDAVVHLINEEEGYPPVSFAAEPSIPPEARGGWGNYARGAAQRLAQQLGRPLSGLDGLLCGAAPYGVPRGAGLSSSSALTVVVAVALASLNGLAAEGPGFAQLCAEAEWYVGTRGGIMDHFCALLARREHAMFLDCRPRPDGSYLTEPVPLPPDYHIVVVNSGVRHQNTQGAYNPRVAACRAGVGLLQAYYPGITHLRDVQEVPWAELEPLLPEETTPAELAQHGIELGDLPGVSPDTPLPVRARCRHVWSENRRVLAAVAALRNGDVVTLGRLLDQAHASARDDYEISCPELESLVQAAREVPGVVGARLTGAGWGGCIVALVPHGAISDFELYVSKCYHAKTGLTPAIFACRAGPGAGEIGLDVQ